MTGRSPESECRAFRDVCISLSLGFKLEGPRFIDIDLPTQTGYLLILATSYVKGEMLDVDEKLKRKVRFSVTFLSKPYSLEMRILTGKEAIGTDEEPQMYRKRPETPQYL